MTVISPVLTSPPLCHQSLLFPLTLSAPPPVGIGQECLDSWGRDGGKHRHWLASYQDPHMQQRTCLRPSTKVSKSMLPVTLPFRYHTRFPVQDWKFIQHAITIIAYSFLACIFVIRQSGFYTCLIHATFSSHTTSSPSISSHMTYSHIIISVSKEAIPTVFLNFLVSSSDFYFSFKRVIRVMEASSALHVFLGSSGTNSNCSKSTEAALVDFILAITKICA